MAHKRNRPSDGGRFTFLLVAFAVLLLVITTRLVWIQLIAAPKYAAQATSQRMRDIELPARRGTIYDREGEPLAVSVDARTVYAAPNTIKDKKGTANALASILGGGSEAYLKKLERDRGFVYIARKVDMESARALEAMKLEGIGFLDDSRRMYPSGELACQVLGFVGLDGKGLAGIEKRYDDILGGQSGVLLGERDPHGRQIPGGVQKSIDAIDGHDIVLTIDKDIQYHAQVELAAAVKKWAAKSGSVVVMNPQTGEIYAMTSTPGYNPNDFRKADPAAFRNRPVADAYEPGSTIKALTAAAVLDKGLFTPDTRLHLPPTLRVAGRTINESHPRAAVSWSVTDIVTNSSNVGAVMLGMRLGKNGLYDYFSKLGLTEVTGVDYPGEGRGWLPKPALWSNSSIANIPFGQGVSATPMQLVRAVGAIANEGVLVTPHFLLEVPEQPAFKPLWAERRAISKKAAAATTGVLQRVVTEGTGGQAAVAGYAVAGKTGTAQVALSNGRGYAKDTYIASFIGYLPAEDAQVLISVKLDEPRNSIYGGMVAAPVFSALGAFAVAHLKIPPSTPSSATTSPVKKRTP